MPRRRTKAPDPRIKLKIDNPKGFQIEALEQFNRVKSALISADEDINNVEYFKIGAILGKRWIPFMRFYLIRWVPEEPEGEKGPPPPPAEYPLEWVPAVNIQYDGLIAAFERQVSTLLGRATHYCHLKWMPEMLCSAVRHMDQTAGYTFTQRHAALLLRPSGTGKGNGPDRPRLVICPDDLVDQFAVDLCGFDILKPGESSDAWTRQFFSKTISTPLADYCNSEVMQFQFAYQINHRSVETIALNRSGGGQGVTYSYAIHLPGAKEVFEKINAKDVVKKNIDEDSRDWRKVEGGKPDGAEEHTGSGSSTPQALIDDDEQMMVSKATDAAADEILKTQQDGKSDSDESTNAKATEPQKPTPTIASSAVQMASKAVASSSSATTTSSKPPPLMALSQIGNDDKRPSRQVAQNANEMLEAQQQQQPRKRSIQEETTPKPSQPKKTINFNYGKTSSANTSTTTSSGYNNMMRFWLNHRPPEGYTVCTPIGEPDRRPRLVADGMAFRQPQLMAQPQAQQQQQQQMKQNPMMKRACRDAISIATLWLKENYTGFCGGTTSSGADNADGAGEYSQQSHNNNNGEVAYQQGYQQVGGFGGVGNSFHGGDGFSLAEPDPNAFNLQGGATGSSSMGSMMDSGRGYNNNSHNALSGTDYMWSAGSYW